MKKKLGPLQAWQWLALGAAVGLIYYVYKARQNAATSNVGSTAATPGSTTDLGPIDPTTGQPYALEGSGSGGISGGTAQNSGPTSLAQELSDLGAIQGLMAGFQQVPLTAASASQGDSGAPVVATTLGLQPSDLQGQFSNLFPQAWSQLRKVGNLNSELGKLQKQVGKLQHPKTNPGHVVTTHNGGKKSASSSAPQNNRQHTNVAPPSHQRANPISHPSTPTGRPPAVPHPPAPKPKPKPTRRRGP